MTDPYRPLPIAGASPKHKPRSVCAWCEHYRRMSEVDHLCVFGIPIVIHPIYGQLRKRGARKCEHVNKRGDCPDYKPDPFSGPMWRPHQ